MGYSLDRARRQGMTFPPLARESGVSKQSLAVLGWWKSQRREASDMVEKGVKTFQEALEWP